MNHVQNHLGEIHNKYLGTVVTRIKNGNCIAVIVKNERFENSNYYKPLRKL